MILRSTSFPVITLYTVPVFVYIDVSAILYQYILVKNVMLCGNFFPLRPLVWSVEPKTLWMLDLCCCTFCMLVPVKSFQFCLFCSFLLAGGPHHLVGVPDYFGWWWLHTGWWTLFMAVSFPRSIVYSLHMDLYHRGRIFIFHCLWTIFHFLHLFRSTHSFLDSVWWTLWFTTVLYNKSLFLFILQLPITGYYYNIALSLLLFAYVHKYVHHRLNWIKSLSIASHITR